ncbi:MAG: 4Fe-4S binding protein [Bacteroides sp.]|jgi:NAD-dependent dihydropyrimidine dehydrogenase PreA subunit|nr:4Fe-4S binding protein [Bacteroides sp.]
MKRTIIKIDEDLCNGCGLCVSGCHEGALQLIDGKARMISDLYCDGLGTCIGDCPEGAITLEEREAEPYNEVAVMKRVVPKGEKTIIAHLNHLIDHDQRDFVLEGLDYLNDNDIKIDNTQLHKFKNEKEMSSSCQSSGNGGGCPGSMAISFDLPAEPKANYTVAEDQPSELKQWPVQFHLLSPQAPYFRNADVLLAADCVAFSMGNFHSKHLKGKSLAIACPKLDANKESYIEKLTAMIDEAKINTLTVMMMEVPCCSGLMQIAKMATQQANRKVPIKAMIVSLQGEVISEDWV